MSTLTFKKRYQLKAMAKCKVSNYRRRAGIFASRWHCIPIPTRYPNRVRKNRAGNVYLFIFFSPFFSCCLRLVSERGRDIDQLLLQHLNLQSLNIAKRMPIQHLPPLGNSPWTSYHKVCPALIVRSLNHCPYTGLLITGLKLWVCGLLTHHVPLSFLHQYALCCWRRPDRYLLAEAAS